MNMLWSGKQWTVQLLWAKPKCQWSMFLWAYNVLQVTTLMLHNLQSHKWWHEYIIHSLATLIETPVPPPGHKLTANTQLRIIKNQKHQLSVPAVASDSCTCETGCSLFCTPQIIWFTVNYQFKKVRLFSFIPLIIIYSWRTAMSAETVVLENQHKKQSFLKYWN